MASSIDGQQFQAALARILTEPALNERFVAEPDSVGRELGLTDGQIAALEAAGLDKLEVFSHNLCSKRTGLLEKVCPATYGLARRRELLQELVRRFVRRHPPVETPEFSSRTIRDGFWFLADVEELARDGRLDDPLLGEVARFERVLLEVTALEQALASAVDFAQLAAAEGDLERSELLARRPRRGGHARVESFSVDILTVVRQLAEGHDPGDPPGHRSLVLFSKLPGWRNVRFAAVNSRTRDLFVACDGASTCREIVHRELSRRTTVDDPAAFTEDCLNLLRQLAALNAVSFVGAPR